MLGQSWQLDLDDEASSRARGEHMLRQLRARRISLAARCHASQLITPRDSLSGVNHLLNRLAGAIAEVEDMLAAFGQHVLQTMYMGIGQIGHMDVIPYAGAI